MNVDPAPANGFVTIPESLRKVISDLPQAIYQRAMYNVFEKTADHVDSSADLAILRQLDIV